MFNNLATVMLLIKDVSLIEDILFTFSHHFHEKKNISAMKEGKPL